MDRLICSIGWEKFFWQGVNQIVMIFCIVLYYLRWYFCEDTQKDHKWSTFNFYVFLKRINRLYIKSLKFLRLTFSDSLKFMLAKSFTSINLRKFMFAKIFNVAYSRKFMFAKRENFANFSIREIKYQIIKIKIIKRNEYPWQ